MTLTMCTRASPRRERFASKSAAVADSLGGGIRSALDARLSMIRVRVILVVLGVGEVVTQLSA